MYVEFYSDSKLNIYQYVCIINFNFSFYSDRSFHNAVPRSLNSLPVELRSLDYIIQFRRCLISLFSQLNECLHLQHT